MSPPTHRGPLVSLVETARPSSTSIPSSQDLIVTTTKGVYAWDCNGAVEMFSSRSEGIVTAKRVQAGKEMLAVADSQLVILHDCERGTQRTYRLRRENQVALNLTSLVLTDNGQGQIRMLYYDTPSQRLFFTTTLQNAVQSYSLSEGRMLDPSPTHPSPPTVFAVSTTFDILLSASAYPRNVLLTRIALNRSPLRLVPTCSSSAIVAATFSSERGNVFALAFADGTIATYNAALFRKDTGLEQRAVYSSEGEIAHVKGLHTPTTVALSRPQALPSAAYDAGTGQIGVGEISASIRAVVFIPGLVCTTASVGADGKCCIVSYRRGSSQGITGVVRTWHVNAPATSLAIAKSKPTSLPQVDGSLDNGREHVVEGLILAIGREDGNVMLYNYNGELLATRDFGANDHILDLEWIDDPNWRRKRISDQGQTRSSSNAASVYHSAQTSPRKPSEQEQFPSAESQAHPTSASPRSKIRVKLHVKNRPSDAEILESPRVSMSNEAGSKHNRTDHNGLPKSRTGSGTNRKPTSRRASSGGRSSRKVSNASSKGSRKSSVNGIPVIPPRPTPRPGGKLALQRKDTASRALKARRSSRPDPGYVAVVESGAFDFIPPSLPAQLSNRKLSLTSSSHSSQISPFSERPHFFMLQDDAKVSIQNEPKIKPSLETLSKPIQRTYIARSPIPSRLEKKRRDSPTAEYHAMLSKERLSSYTGNQADGPNSVPQVSSTSMISPTRPPLKNPNTNVSQIPRKTGAAKKQSAGSASDISSGSIVEWSPPQAKRPLIIPKRPADTPERSIVPAAAAPPPTPPLRPIDVVDSSTSDSLVEWRPRPSQLKPSASTEQAAVPPTATKIMPMAQKAVANAVSSPEATSSGSSLEWHPQHLAKVPVMVDAKPIQPQQAVLVSPSPQPGPATPSAFNKPAPGPPSSGSSGSMLDWQPQQSAPKLVGPPKVNVIAASNAPNALQQPKFMASSQALHPPPAIRQNQPPKVIEASKPVELNSRLTLAPTTPVVSIAPTEPAQAPVVDKGKQKAVDGPVPQHEEPVAPAVPAPHREPYTGPPPPAPVHETSQQPARTFLRSTTEASLESAPSRLSTSPRGYFGFTREFIFHKHPPPLSCSHGPLISALHCSPRLDLRNVW